jgi:DNA repair exonuclease SbcCD ATPase subunit
MQESGIYTQQDLQPFVQRLHVVKSIIKKDKEEGKQYTGVVKLMWRKTIMRTERLLKTLLKSLSVLSVELVPIHQRLVHIRRQLSALAAQLKHEKKELKPLVEELRKIDSSRVDGKFLGPGGTSVPAGQAILVGLLEECFEIIQDIRAREGAENVSPPLKPVWERLTEMRAKLERLREYSKVRKRFQQSLADDDVWTA